MSKKICIICSAKLPQPPVLGGAVSALIQHWIDENELENRYELTCVSVYNKKAEELAPNFKHCDFKYVKTSRVSRFFDKVITAFLNLIKKTNKIYAWGFLFRMLSFRKGVRKVLLKSDFDYVIFENSIPVALCMKRRRLRNKYKGKYFYHTHCVPRKAFNSGKVLENAKAVICVSNYIKEATLKRFEDFNLYCEVLYNCVNTDIFKPQNKDAVQKWRIEHGLSNDDFAVGFIGRISKDKGIIELIEAMKKIDNPNIKLLVVGSTFYNSDTKDKMILDLMKSAEPIKDRTIFTGYINNSDTPMFYCASDLICLPPVWEEPGAVTNIEAAACGRPILSTLSGGNKEYIGNDRSVLLDKSNKNKLIDELASNIIDLYKNQKRRDLIAKNALDWASKQTKNEFYKRLVGIID